MIAHHSPTLLLVEDAPEIRLLLASSLGKAGYLVLQAENGKEGVNLWEAEQPDLVLMDVKMPIMDGFAACRMIRTLETSSTTPVLMLTGSNDLGSINQAFEAGASDFITKPVNLPLLEQRIRYALRDAEREQALRKARSRQDSARALAGLVFWDYDPESDRLRWLKDTATIFPWLDPLPDSLNTLLAAIHHEDRQRLQVAFHAAVKEGIEFDLEVRALETKNQSVVKMVGKREEATQQVIGASQDVTQIRSLERQTEYLKHHDAVTGLPNRGLFLTSLDEKLSQHTPPLAVAVVHVSGLHRISDALGVEVSDQLMVELSSQLKAQLRQQAHGYVARVESDSFALWLDCDELQSDLALESALHAILQPLMTPLVIDNHDLLANLTVGVSQAPEQATSAMTLLRFAQRAMRDVPGNGRRLAICIYQPGEIDQLARRISLESDLRRAVAQKDFRLVYQPQLSLETGRIIGVESLLRWDHPEQGMVSPGLFIPLLEDMGLIQELGCWIMEQACRQQKQWERQGVPLRMSINLSPSQFSQGNLVEQVQLVADSAGVAPESIKLEITESLAMQDTDLTIEMLKSLRNRGFKIAIDDFGVGFSSLEYLLQFPLDSLKIDRAFVKNVTRKRSDRAIVQSLISLCQNLGISTIAEGIETQRQMDYLDALGAHEIQGFLIARPLEYQDVLPFIAQYTHSTSDDS